MSQTIDHMNSVGRDRNISLKDKKIRVAYK